MAKKRLVTVNSGDLGSDLEDGGTHVRHHDGYFNWAISYINGLHRCPNGLNMHR